MPVAPDQTLLSDREEEEQEEKRVIRWQDFVPIAIVVALFVVGFFLLLIKPTRDWLVDVLEQSGKSNTAAIVFSLVFVVSIILGLPSVIFVVAAGIVWGGFVGFLSVWTGGLVGAAIVYQIGRTWLKGSLDVLCWNKSTTLREVKMLISDPETGWKWAIMMRVPYMPYPQMSYALSATDITFWNYMWTSAVGSVPGVFSYIYLGTGIKNLKDYTTSASGGSIATIVLQLASAGVCIVMFTVLAVVARRRVSVHARVSASGFGNV